MKKIFAMLLVAGFVVSTGIIGCSPATTPAGKTTIEVKDKTTTTTEKDKGTEVKEKKTTVETKDDKKADGK